MIKCGHKTSYKDTCVWSVLGECKCVHHCEYKLQGNQKKETKDLGPSHADTPHGHG